MNLEEIKKRLQQLNARNTSKTDKFFKPKDEHDVRLLRQPDSDDPFVERLFHKNVGTEWPVMCPKSFGEECSICEFATKLAAWKDDDGRDKDQTAKKKDWELFRKIQAKPRYYVAVVERGKEDAGAKWWSCTDFVYKELLNICVDPECNADRDDGGGIEVLVSETSGYDVGVSYQKPGEKGNNTAFNNTKVKEKKKPSKLHADKAAAKKILESIVPLDEVLPPTTAKEAHKAFMAFVSGGSKDPDGDGSDEAGKEDVEYGDEKPATKRKAKSNNAEKLTGKKSVDEAFSELADS